MFIPRPSCKQSYLKNWIHVKTVVSEYAKHVRWVKVSFILN